MHYPVSWVHCAGVSEADCKRTATVKLSLWVDGAMQPDIFQPCDVPVIIAALSSSFVSVRSNYLELNSTMGIVFVFVFVSLYIQCLIYVTHHVLLFLFQYLVSSSICTLLLVVFLSDSA